MQTSTDNDILIQYNCSYKPAEYNKTSVELKIVIPERRKAALNDVPEVGGNNQYL